MNTVVTDVNNYYRNFKKIIKYLTYLILIEIFLTTFIICQPNNKIDLQQNLNLNNNNNKNVEFDASKLTKNRKYSTSMEQNNENNQKKSSKKGKHSKKNRKQILKFSTSNFNDETPTTIENQKQYTHLDPNKIYFDYYPVEKVDVNYDPSDDDKINVILLSKIKTNEYDKNDDNAFNHTNQENKINKIIKTDRRRIKRDLNQVNLNENNKNKNIQINSNQNNNVKKRNVNYIEKFIGSEQGRGYQYSPPSYSTATSVGNYYTFGTVNDPWNNEYNRFYDNLPRQPPSTYQIYLKYPIRGIYYNPISPSGNNFIPVIPNEGGENPIQPGFVNRFGDELDRPIWGSRPNTNAGGFNSPPINELPPPISRPIERSTSPPLIHNPKRPGSNTGQERPQQPATQRPPQQSQTNRPVNNPPGGFRTDNSASGQSSGSFNDNSNNLADTQPIQQPSRCIWAIVACCTRNNLDVRFSCFEQVGCHGAFWDLNPCADQYRRVAVAETSKFIN